MSDWAPDIFDFLDYRAFIEAWYEAGKEHTRHVSWRYLARRAGFSSPSYLRDVMLGKKNLGPQSIAATSNALDLDESDAAYFASLVDFNQADTPQEKNEAFEKVASSRRFQTARRIDAAMFEYLSRWYIPAIREMAARADFDGNPEVIASSLVPAISEEQASRALEVLFELGLLEETENGGIARRETSLTTGHEVRNLAVGNYHRQMLERAAESLELVHHEYRDLAAMTVCISKELIPELKRRVHEFRRLLMEICDSDPNPELVFQINTQLFALSDPDS